MHLRLVLNRELLMIRSNLLTFFAFLRQKN